jgi:hypothetical protein
MRIDEIDGITVYRGISPRNLPARYPGTYYTEIRELAVWYSRGGQVIKKTINPRKTFDIDVVHNLEPYKKYQILQKFQEFLEKKYPDMDISDTQLYDNLQVNSVSDFAYPTQADVDFLKLLGYDSVYFMTEGGKTVRTWFMFN